MYIITINSNSDSLNKNHKMSHTFVYDHPRLVKNGKKFNVTKNRCYTHTHSTYLYTT